MWRGDIYCWVATAICLTGTVINVKRINICFYFWVVGEVMWVAYDVGQSFFSRTILDLVGLALAVWGAWENDLRKRIDGLGTRTKSSSIETKGKGK